MEETKYATREKLQIAGGIARGVLGHAADDIASAYSTFRHQIRNLAKWGEIGAGMYLVHRELQRRERDSKGREMMNRAEGGEKE
ncbi:MAG: hypothetical protein KJ879_02760 [Nanoarchaeota archaeon]|nr:hypothetical protein [Nanoarchaeota archaeon]